MPGSLEWLNKLIFSANYGAISGQLVGDYVAKVHATHTNALSIPNYLLLSGQASYAIRGSLGVLHDAKISLNVSNLLQKGQLRGGGRRRVGNLQQLSDSAAAVFRDFLGEPLIDAGVDPEILSIGSLHA